MASKKLVVFITGCSSGIGEALCREFHQRGCRVIATARRLESLEKLKAEGLDTLKLDVNNRDDVNRVVKTILESNDGIDFLINNAGYALIGPSIELSDSELRSQLETNFISPIALIRAVAPGMKKKGQGKIVNIGSISGLVTTPFSGVYCASKAALHSISDALRMELEPFGIQVITIQPGAIQSQFGSAALATAEESTKSNSWYGPLRQAISDRANLSQEDATPSHEFASKLVDALLAKRTPPIIRLGKKSLILPLIRLLLPSTVLDKILMKKFGLNRLKRNP